MGQWFENWHIFTTFALNQYNFRLIILKRCFVQHLVGFIQKKLWIAVEHQVSPFISGYEKLILLLENYSTNFYYYQQYSSIPLIHAQVLIHLQNELRIFTNLMYFLPEKENQV
jgi:hypothetical protein